MSFLNYETTQKYKIISICRCKWNILILFQISMNNPYLSKQYIFKIDSEVTLGQVFEKFWLSMKHIVNSKSIRLAYFWHLSHVNFHGKSFSRVYIYYSLSCINYCYFTRVDNGTTCFLQTGISEHTCTCRSPIRQFPIPNVCSATETTEKLRFDIPHTLYIHEEASLVLTREKV